MNLNSMTSSEIRKKFLTFFEEKEHLIVESSPMVNKDDPTLMFINAGMNQFKDYFLGNATPPRVRITDTQKCLRVSGKHNDLEEVGRDSYHQTMFEMLGNWSFGDYFKKEAIAWAWEFLIDVGGLSPDRMYVTVFSGDDSDGLDADEESASFWKDLVPEDRILYFDRKDNFWEMGETGPCGPCSEIHYDLRSDSDRSDMPGAGLVNADHPLLIEIWNLVFIQYDRKADKSLVELPNKHVDTGMGFERLVMALQGKTSNYDTDVFSDAIKFVASKSGIAYSGLYKEEAKSDIAMRVLADHSRAVAFAIADGAIPSNTGPGYVIRRILRRAIRYYYTYLHLNDPLIFEMVDLWAKYYEGIFPELSKQSAFIKKLIEQEELSFLRTIEAGLRKLENVNIHSNIISGQDAFELYDTYGFPIDLTRLIAAEKGLAVDENAFKKALQDQRNRSRVDAKRDLSDWTIVSDLTEVEFVGYDQLEVPESRIIKYRTATNKSKMEYHAVFEMTPFYPEGGGQIGDHGVLIFQDEKVKVLDTFKENNLIIHRLDKLPVALDSPFVARVDRSKRKSTERNHTGTHLVHAALRKVLGGHVEQRGSLVNNKYLRFDFSHFQQVTDDEIKEVESLVNEAIRRNIPKIEKRNLPIQQAKDAGAMMLFGEKYGDDVRMITFDKDYSVELCGGCHVERTGDIGWFKIITETSVAAGIRRIEAVTGLHAERYIFDELATFSEIKAKLKNPKNVPGQLEKLIEENKKLTKEIENHQKDRATALKDDLIKSSIEYKGISIVIKEVDIVDPTVLKNLAFSLINHLGNSVVLLGLKNGPKAGLTLAVDKSLVDSHGIDASVLIRPIAKIVNGGGGGQKFFATAGGSDPSQMDAALEEGTTLIKLAIDAST